MNTGKHLIPIKIFQNKKQSRLFDVNVDEKGNIVSYETKGKQGFLSISAQEMQQQIEEHMKKVSTL